MTPMSRDDEITRGSCLCGEVEFEVSQIVAPFELCHCSRCRKASGSAYAAFLEVKTKGYRIVRGRELIRSYQSPLIDKPPPYEVWFCSKCGAPLPNPHPEGDMFEIPAGLLDGRANMSPDKHIYVDFKAEWDDIDKTIPSFTKDEICAFRETHGRVVAQLGAATNNAKRHR